MIFKFIKDFALANSLSETLGSFALLQLMLFPLAFNFLYPINVADTSEVAIETASMDIFPVDVFEFQAFEEDPPSPRLVLLGFESENFADNSSTSLLFFIV